MTKASLLAVALLILATAGAGAQTPRTCVDQYSEAKSTTPASLLAAGFDIKVGWPGSLWMQKGKEAYVCNTGRVPDGQTICWSLREPVKGQPCE